MPKKKPVRLANPDQPGAQEALDRYRASADAPSMGLLIGTNAYMVLALTASNVLEPTGPAALLMYAIWGSLLAALIFIQGRTHLRNRAFRHHKHAGHIITVDPYLIEAWDELREEQGVELTDDQREMHIRKLFAAATELQDDLTRRADALKQPELGEQKLMAEARIRARLLREVEVLRAIQEAEREIAKLPAASMDIVTPEEVVAQLKTLRARQQPDAVDESSEEN